MSEPLQTGSTAAGARRFVISLCDRTGEAVKPWLAAGFRCVLVDLQHPRGVTTDGFLTLIGASVFELHPYHRWMPEGDCFIAFAWPECTHFTYSGARWRRENGPTATAEGFRLFGACWDLLRYYEREHGSRWMLENPKGIPWSWCKPDFTFHPWQYGDNESKETGIWCGGGFEMPNPSVLVKPSNCQESVLEDGAERRPCESSQCDAVRVRACRVRRECNSA